MKNKNSVKGMHNVRTMTSIRRNDAEKQNSVYIELYMLSKEEKRIRDEKKRIELRLDAINSRLEDIAKFRSQVIKPENREVEQAKQAGTDDQPGSQNEWNVMPLKY
jgi:hypothetical protein